MRRYLLTAATVVLAFIVATATAFADKGGNGHGNGGGGGGSGAKVGRDNSSPPSISISAPSAETTVSGSVNVSGSASDSTSVASVQVSVDGGAYQSAQGTTSWSFPLDTASYANGSHTLTAQATDSSGNTGTASETVTFGNSTADTTPPTVSISAPAAGSTVSDSVTVSGSASDNVGVASVEVSLDGSAYQAAQGTTSWSLPLDTTALANGNHTIAARATDSSGNTAMASETVTVGNSTADTTPPTVSISAPAAGSTVSGSVTVSGSASDNVGVASVEVSVDGGAYQAAQGTTSWSLPLDTTALANGNHTLTARATDTSGNVSTASDSATVQNGTASTLPPGIAQQLVTPEGTTIDVYSDATGWTAQQVYDLLKPNARELSLIGPMLTIEVRGEYASGTSVSVQGDPTVGYSHYRATMYLQAIPGSTFTAIPDDIIAHEYGHAWSLYHLYIGHDGDWTSYLEARALYGNPLLDSSYMWNVREIIAEDYRLLLGDTAAQDETAQMNYQIPDARTVSGLKTFLANSWG